MTHTERTQRDIYGDDAIDDGVEAITRHNQRIAHHRDQHEDEDEEDDPMDLDYSEETLSELTKSLVGRLDLVDEVPLVRFELRKAIEDLSDDLAHQARDTGHLARRMDAVKGSLALAYQAERRSRRNQAAIGCLAKAVDGFFQGLTTLGTRVQTPLQKAAGELIAQGQAQGYLGRVDAQGRARVEAWTRQHFGPRGGTYCRYTPEQHATAKVCQSLTKSQQTSWQTFNRLPDGVRLDQPSPGAQAERNTSIMVQHALASMGLSPLVFPALARRT
jgi:hypothetical protein